MIITATSFLISSFFCLSCPTSEETIGDIKVIQESPQPPQDFPLSLSLVLSKEEVLEAPHRLFERLGPKTQFSECGDWQGHFPVYTVLPRVSFAPDTISELFFLRCTPHKKKLTLLEIYSIIKNYKMTAVLSDPSFFAGWWVHTLTLSFENNPLSKTLEIVFCQISPKKQDPSYGKDYML
jgi:hypothetical protein